VSESVSVSVSVSVSQSVRQSVSVSVSPSIVCQSAEHMIQLGFRLQNNCTVFEMDDKKRISV
jgi:hypothetical protein